MFFYNPENGFERTSKWSEEAPDGRWRALDRQELLARDKASLDLFWLRDASMTDLDSLPEPEVLADKIVENLRSALASFEDVSQETTWSGDASLYLWKCHKVGSRVSGYSSILYRKLKTNIIIGVLVPVEGLEPPTP